MNRIIKKGILYFLSLFFVLLLSLLSSSNYVYALGYNGNLTTEEKEYYNVEELDISEKNVSLDSVIITLTKEETIKFLNYTSDDFSEIGCLSIEDLTMHTVDDVENSYNKNTAVTKKMIDYENFRRILKLEISDKSINGVINAIRILMNKDNVLSVIPNYKIHLTALPNDEHYKNNDMWGLNGTYGISADNAWDISVGCSEVNVAVIDSGIEYNHPDLKNRINDTNIHRDFTVSATTPIEAVDLTDSDGHGTHVAGIIAGEGNNNSGIVGVAWDVRLVSLKVFENNKGEVSHLCSAINYAADQEIPIINFSGGMYGYEYRLYSALRGYNGLFVCAVGNDGKDVDYDNHYPSHFSYDYDFSNRVISVGSINKKGNRSNFSNYSSSGNRVNIYAPGEDILSTVPYHLCPTGCRGFFHSWSSNHKARGYHYNSGTSMASPFVAGAAAVLLSANNMLSAEHLKKAIINGADTITIKIPNPTGSGEINQEVLSLNLYNSLKSIAYKVNSDGNIITGIWFNPVNSLNIPDKINGVTITGIGENAFKDISIIESVDLPNGLLTIGNAAFKNCVNLNNIIIPNNVTNIDSSAFENCTSLESVTLSNSLYAIGVGAFIGCSSLRSINIPASVQHIDSSAFENCSSLTSVTVNKSQEAITHIGENAFDGCSTSLQIIVPKNRLAEYKNKVYWSSYKNKIIPDSTDFDELNLHCLVYDSSDVTLSAGYNELYKLNVECNKSYNFMTSSGIELKVYDEYFDELYTGENTLYAYLSPGTYYLDVRYNSSTASGTITIDYELRWTHDGERVYYNDEHNLLTHLHETSDGTYFNKLYYINNNGAGLYKFQLNGTYSNNLPIVYDSGTLTIYNDSGRLETQILNRYPNSSIMASSDDNQDTMYVYLPRNGYFYINVVMPSKSYESLSLIVSPISSQNINLFNLNENANHLISVINNTDKGDYVETLNVEQTGKFTISYNYNGSSTDNFVFLLVKQNYNSTTNQYSFSTIINETMNATNNSFTYTGNLEAGKYYIGYLNKNDSSSVVVNFVRLVTDSDNQKLLPDPDMFTVYGSEVRFNNGVCRGTNLTVGFTRFIYLDNTLDIRSQSRLDYYWYSSDENVASISDYGTLLGLSPGTVKIMAVYKNDPSVVYVKQFTVLPDTRTEDLAVEISESITYAESGQIYEISLTDTNSPYPLNSLYEWSVVLDESSYSVTVTEWGTFSMSGTGTIVLEGRSKLNPHLVVRFTLIVT